jgi:hypothetical protein
MKLSPLTRSTSLLVMMAFAAVLLSGCGGGGEMGAPSGIQASDLPNYHSPEQWIALIETAGFEEYATLGRELVSEGRVKFVAPPTLDASFNAFAWTTEREIWINAPMFDRYPGIVQQATIFLHEMIHIATAESTHAGPEWAVLDQFAVYWRNHPLSQ